MLPILMKILNQLHESVEMHASIVRPGRALRVLLHAERIFLPASNPLRGVV